MFKNKLFQFGSGKNHPGMIESLRLMLQMDALDNFNNTGLILPELQDELESYFKISFEDIRAEKRQNKARNDTGNAGGDAVIYLEDIVIAAAQNVRSPYAQSYKNALKSFRASDEIGQGVGRYEIKGAGDERYVADFMVIKGKGRAKQKLFKFATFIGKKSVETKDDVTIDEDTKVETILPYQLAELAALGHFLQLHKDSIINAYVNARIKFYDHVDPLSDHNTELVNSLFDRVENTMRNAYQQTALYKKIMADIEHQRLFGSNTAQAQKAGTQTPSTGKQPQP